MGIRKVKNRDVCELLCMIEDSPMLFKLDEYLKKGLTHKRHRWDCLWSVNKERRTKWFDRVYQYANDTHIDSALRHAVHFHFVCREEV